MTSALDTHQTSAGTREERSDTGFDPDRQILRRVADGDAESFGVLVQRHQHRLYRLCLRLLGEPEEAREATQDVFMKVFRSAAAWKPRGQVYTWIYRIAVNHCLNRLRRRKIVRFFGFGDLAGPDGDDGPEFEPADAAPDAERRLRSRESWRETRRWIDQLPAGQRTVLVLAKFEGLSYKEISETLDITLGAVESRLFRAMRTLSELRSGERGGPVS